jgi:inward rectifier potassium channel
MTQSSDIGFGINIGKRLLLPNGRFNVQKINASKDVFRHLITCSFKNFIGLVLLIYLVINILFAIAFNLIGIENLEGIANHGLWSNLANAFFFSVQTFTTVGYGAVHPASTIANILASLDALIGILSIAIISGILLLRVTQRKEGLIYSRNAVIVPYDNNHALMFRAANGHHSEIIDLQARVLASFFRPIEGELKRDYLSLELEKSEVMFFPLSWTIVHIIDDKSPLFKMTKEDMLSNELEVIILLSGHDDTLKEKIYSKKSYTFHEILWNHKFKPAFENLSSGETRFDLSKISDTVELA